MSTATTNLPATPVRPAVMATQNGEPDILRKIKQSSSQKDFDESIKLSEALAIHEAPDKIETPSTQPSLVVKDQQATQSENPPQDQHNTEPDVTSNERAASPHDLEPFDWDDFQARYDQAMAEAKTTEQALLNEFEQLSNYFGVWAAAALEYDDNRALKRLKTRETYIQTAEQALEEKKRQYTQVVEAFKNALALLGGS